LLPHRIVRLMEILEYYSPSRIGKIDPNFAFCGIIFVEQRYVAYVMNLLLKAIAKWNKETFDYLRPDFVIGYNSVNVGSEETLALHKRQEDVLRKFRQKHLNLLVATSVLEEGVDVKQCNVVIRFDRPTDYRAYIQSKGRARKEGANYFMLVEQSDKAKCASDLRDFFQIEQVGHFLLMIHYSYHGTMLLKRYRTTHNPPDDLPLLGEIDVDCIIPPYVVESTGAKVTMSSAISLVNRSLELFCFKMTVTHFLTDCSKLTVLIRLNLLCLILYLLALRSDKNFISGRLLRFASMSF
uniref:Endoribonuclease dcr-1 (inferred by orthology to a C. elegans protein) n=1 Tax=Anisakis simplex TaxID=6269 RepID=A0A0M3KHS9_ANISI